MFHTTARTRRILASMSIPTMSGAITISTGAKAAFPSGGSATGTCASKTWSTNTNPICFIPTAHLPFEDYGLSLIAHHYNANAQRNGGKTQAVYTSKRQLDAFRGMCVLDVERGIVDKIWPRPWQTDTCIGDWHYKRGVKYKTPKTVVDMLVDIVSRNGNLLLNFPLPASGALDFEELGVLAGITKWMSVNSEAIYATRPWKIFGEGPGTEASANKSSFNERERKDLTAADVRFTTKGDTLYAFVMGWPEYQAVIRPLATKTELRVGRSRTSN